MSETSSSPSPEMLDAEVFIEQFTYAAPGTAFRLMDGILDAPDAPDLVVSTYDQAHAADMVDILGAKHREHAMAAFGPPDDPTPQAPVKVAYTNQARWVFEPEHADYRMKRIAVRAPSGEYLPAALLKTTSGFDIIDCWLIKDVRPLEPEFTKTSAPRSHEIFVKPHLTTQTRLQRIGKALLDGQMIMWTGRRPK